MARPEPLYVSEADAARLLGHGPDWLRQNAATLEAQYGFPKIDPAVKKRHRAAIEAWALGRNMRNPPNVLEQSTETDSNKENIDAF